eukprot:1217276-Alexandrium_andersonii.AAC.1
MTDPTRKREPVRATVDRQAFAAALAGIVRTRERTCASSPDAARQRAKAEREAREAVETAEATA